MTAIIDGSSLGLVNSSLRTLGFAPGDPLTGRGGEDVYVNAASNANLVQTRVRYRHDDANRLASVSVDLSPQDSSDGTRLSVSYDSNARVTGITNAPGEQTSFLYDASGASTAVTWKPPRRSRY